MLHITFNMHLVLSMTAWSPSDFICSYLTWKKRFCIDVVNWQLLVCVPLSEACSAFALNCGHPTLKYGSLHSPLSYSSLNYCINGRFQGSFSIWSFPLPEYMFSNVSLQQQWLNFTTDATSHLFYLSESSFPYNHCIQQLGISKNTKYHEKHNKPKRDNHIHHLFYTPSIALASGSGPTV